MRTPLLLLTPGQVCISQVKQKIKWTGGRKKRQNMDLIWQHSKKVRSATFLATLHVSICGYRKNFVKTINSYQKCWLISLLRSWSLLGICLYWPHAAFWLLETLLSWVSLSDCESLTVNSSTLSLRLNWLTSLVLLHPNFQFTQRDLSRQSDNVQRCWR